LLYVIYAIDCFFAIHYDDAAFADDLRCFTPFSHAACHALLRFSFTIYIIFFAAAIFAFRRFADIFAYCCHDDAMFTRLLRCLFAAIERHALFRYAFMLMIIRHTMMLFAAMMTLRRFLPLFIDFSVFRFSPIFIAIVYCFIGADTPLRH